MIRVMLISQFMFFCFFGLVFGLTIQKVRERAEHDILIQLPESAYSDLSINLLLKIPVEK